MDCNRQGELDCAFDLESGVSSSDNESNSREVSLVNVKVSTEKKLEREKGSDILEKKMGKEKCKKTSAKKPPRPPRGLSLDAADQKLIKEIAELATLKRARADRMKALKKKKAAKASLPNGNLFAMLFTILFCLAILFQGLSSRNSSAVFHGSPMSAGAIEGGFISVDHHWSPSSSDTNLLGSWSSKLMEQGSGLEAEGKRQAEQLDEMKWK